VDVKSLTTYQARNTNLNNFNQLASVQSSLWSRFTPTDAVTWSVVQYGGVSNNFANYTNAWGVVENSASRLTLTASSFDMWLSFSGLTAGLNLVIKVWVKLGASGMNFNITPNNTLAFNTMAGYCFTAADGLNTTSYTQVSLATTTMSTAMNIHIGSHGQTGQTQQVAGTVLVYGWQIFLVGATSTTLETNLIVDGSLKCASLMVNNINMPTPAYMRVQLSTATYPASITSDITWTSATASTLVMVSSPGASIRLPAIGVYLIAGKISIQSQITSSCYLQIQTSTDFTSWNYVEYNQVVSLAANGDFQIASYLLPTTVVNQLIKVTIYNTMTSAIIFNSGYSQSFLNVVRIA
jgi:hypothetical protein